MRRALLGSTILISGLIAAVAYIVAEIPRARAERFEISSDATGVSDGHALSYVVRHGSQAVLIDAGNDPSASALLAELARHGLDASAVVAILVTHGHFDHWAGARQFPRATMYVGSADHPWVRRVELPEARLPRLTTRLVHPAPYLGNVHEVLAGEAITVAGMRFLAVPLPGHTPGSMAYLWGEVLFTGDALFLTSAGVRPPPWFLCENAGDSRRSIARLAALPFDVVADGHVGIAHSAKSLVTGWLGEHQQLDASP